MSSLRSRSQSRNMSGNGPMQRRAIGHMETSSEDFTHGQGTVTSKPTSRLPAPRFTTQSRIPQNPAARRPSASNTQPHVKDAGQPWNSTVYSSQSTPAYRSSAIPVKEKEIGTTQPRARPVLRRKQSLVPTGSSNARNPPLANHEKANSTSMMPRPQVLVDLPAPRLEQNVPKAPVESHIPLKVDLPVTRTETLYPELDRYRNIQVPRDGPASEMLFRLATHDLPPPTPLFSGASSHSQLSSFSGSPSTRFSESPGGGPYSRDTTPTSMSSVSPGLVFPSRSTVTRIKQPSRPPVTRRRAGSTTRADDDDASDIDSHALSIVQESLASSSSSSTTVRDVEKNSKKKGLLESRPPNPPPRKSSHKLRKEYDNHASPSKTSRKQAPLVMRSPSPVRSPPQTLPLNVQKVTASPQARATPPSRPSRENTPDLYSQFGGPLPIIQSNLSSTSLTERRRSGQIVPSSLPRSMSSTSIQDQQIRPKVPVSRQPTPNPKPTPTSLPQPGKAEPSRPTRTPSPGVSTFRSKFGLFTRRKTDSDANADKKEKPSRKGPAAGTGHEGYGKMGAVRRRNSSTAPPAGASSSSDSLASTQSVDPFFLARLNPVVIAGGEIIENRNASAEISRNDSSQSLAYTRPSIDSRKGSSTSLSSREDARNTLWPSAMPHPSHSHRPSNSSDIGADPMKSTLAFRRSIQRLGTTGDHKPVNLPQPINTRGITSPSLASVDTIFTDDSLALSQSDLELPQTQLAPAPRKLTKRPKSPRKWNLFGRSQKKDTTATKPTAVDAAPSKPVAFYTIIDSSEQEDSERPDITDILRDADIVVPPSLPTQSTTGQGHERNPSTLSQDSADQPTQPTLAQGVAMSQKQNSPMIFQPQTSLQHKPVDVEMKTGQIKTSVGRPSRLPQVGRIPKVVNRRPEHTSTKSFSRPFNRISFQLPPPNRRSMNGDSIAKGPSPPTSSTPELSQDASTITTSTVGPPPRSLGHKKSRSLDSARPSGEFLAFPIRKGSECTTSSSSSSSGIALFAQHVAVIPAPTAPLAEDEIWDEYNDLLGDVPPSATSSRGIPFHLENYGTKLAKRITGPLESPTVRTFPPQEQVEDEPKEEPKDEAKDVRSSITTGKSTSSHFSADMTARINAAFRFGTEPPETPFSVSEFVSEYEDRNNTTESPDIRRSVQRSSASSAKSRQTRASGSSSASDETPLAQVNLRVGSMTVSKWLTFGHVLFSPARDELVPVVGSLKRHSILVIDGLGNDDWSFYAAETYPAATFFNLSPRAPVSQEQRTATQFPASPSNHHQIQYTSHMDKFPFGSESFTTVVFRFPAMAPESHYRNIISEARRVLKPGGYVELSILDVDLNKMGSHTRRAVRQLKERISAQQAEISLSSTADTILRLLGKQGFTDIKNCWVGVPVASAIAGSSSERGSRRRTKDERSLAEMMNDETEKGDANITKMVAKVGRWWYNRLYETSTGMKTSIWRDRTLLAECEECDTRLKLMVCYAKMPETKTRLASI